MALGVPEIFVEGDMVGAILFKRLEHSYINLFSIDSDVVFADGRRKKKGVQ